MLTYHSPAKVNLVLEVLGKYDGYHQISSIVQAISLCDILNFQLSEELCFKCSEPSLEHHNLVMKAATLLKETTTCSKGAQIELRKHIPFGVGLGGGSSNAATTILALNKLWELELPVSKLIHLASRLGSDVPFFIYGGAALVEGIGEKITPLPSLPPVWFILLVPPLPKIPDKTKQLYGRLNSSHFTTGQFVYASLPSLMQGKIIDPSLMFNVFGKVAFDVFPGLNEYKKKFEEAGAQRVYIAGSGPCLFTIAYEEEEASELRLRLREQKLQCYVASPLPRHDRNNCGG